MTGKYGFYKDDDGKEFMTFDTKVTLPEGKTMAGEKGQYLIFAGFEDELSSQTEVLVTV